MSKQSRSDYSKGRQDGKSHAEYERDATAGERVADTLVNDPRYDHKGSDDYKEGFRDGRKDEQSKKN